MLAVMRGGKRSSPYSRKPRRAVPSPPKRRTINADLIAAAGWARAGEVVLGKTLRFSGRRVDRFVLLPLVLVSGSCNRHRRAAVRDLVAAWVTRSG
jgi:hypothetical protein